MKAMLYLARSIDRMSAGVGWTVKWLLLATTLLSAVNAITRKAFDLSSNGMLETQWYLFSAVFLLGAGYCFSTNSHVRIDFISNLLSPKGRNIVDIVGILFILLPFCGYVVYLGGAFFLQAWISGEMSGNSGGLIRWPAYLLIPAGFALLSLQALAELCKRILFLVGVLPDSLAEAEESAGGPIVQSMKAEQGAQQ